MVKINDKKDGSLENNENNSTESKIGFTERLRGNPWMVSTIALGVIAIILLLSNFNGITGNTVSGDKLGQTLLELYESSGATGLTLESFEEKSGLYKFNFNYQGAVIPIYATKDGKLAGSMSELPSQNDSSSSGTTQTEVTPSDRPTIGLYIWSYCPYGVTALGPFAQVATLLKDYADFKVYLYYAGHGDFELQQNKIQACIQKLGYQSYWKYAETFANDIYTKCSGDINCDMTESVKLMKSLGIDSDKVLACVKSDGETLLEEDSNSALEFGVTGSPTLVVNGVKVSASRTAEAYKTAVCSAFNTVPSACSTELSGTAATTSGSCG